MAAAVRTDILRKRIWCGFTARIAFEADGKHGFVDEEAQIGMGNLERKDERVWQNMFWR